MEIKEEWRTIQDYPDYMISNLGRVKSLNYNKTGKEKILKQGINKDGYCYVDLCKEGERKTFRVHRLVATHFIPNPQILPCVNHKDENKQNNCVSNLEWCTQEYNCNYGKRNVKISKANSKPILQFNREGTKIIGKWKSIVQVERELGISNITITKCCKGKRNSARKYKWKYLSDYINEQIQYLNELKEYRNRLYDILKKVS